MGRALCCQKMGLKKGPWSTEEDHILINYINQNGHDNWRALPKRAGLLRCGKSCRLRWMNYLRPDIKRGNFTREEEDAIIKLHAELGNKWSVIAARLPGRTDNEIKNVWNTHLKKKKLHGKSQPVPETNIRDPKLDKYYSEPISPTNSSTEISSVTAVAAETSDDSKVTDSLHDFTEIDGSFWSEVFSGDDWSATSDFSAGNTDFQFQFSNSFASDIWCDMIL